MNVLAIDTATEVLGIALSTGVERRVTTVKIGLKHSETLLPWIKILIEDSGIQLDDLQLIVCSLGPGSFTGLRIGLATAKGLAAGSHCPLIGIPGLDALAFRYRSFRGVVIPLSDARRKKVYTALYRQGERISDYLDIPMARLALDLKEFGNLLLTGSEAEVLARIIAEEQSREGITLDRGLPFTDPESLLEIGKELFNRKGNIQYNLEPLYLKKSEAEIKLYGEALNLE
jgi:tRNA threonylcarbamoyladenosine biosynthesis protein TsaB